MSLAAVFQIGSLGDSIVSLPSLLSIRELLPDCKEYLLISRFESNSRVLPSDVFEMAWKPTAQIGYNGRSNGFQQVLSAASVSAQIRYYKPTHCVYLLPSVRSQKAVDRDRLFFKASGVKNLIGFQALSNSELAPGPAPNFKHNEAFLRFQRIWNGLAEEKFNHYSSTPLLNPSSSAKYRAEQWLSVNRQHPTKRLAIFSPYSNAESKDNPQSTIIELIHELQRVANVEVVLLGGLKDSERAEDAIRNAGAGLNACGIFSLQESAALLTLSSLAICVDSGPMHLAGALGVPTVVSFSRIIKEISRWLPLGHGHTLLYRELECAGCKSVRCPVAGHPCMRDITANQILSAVLNKLDGSEFPINNMQRTSVLAW
jgi:hypothetical protein